MRKKNKIKKKRKKTRKEKMHRNRMLQVEQL